MLTKKQIQKLTQKMVKKSFDEKNNLKKREVAEFVKLLKKLESIEAILALDWYLKGLNYQLDKTALRVTSAVPLSPEMKNRILRVVKKDHTVTAATFQVDSSILGGIKLKIADEIINASVKGKIEELKSYAN